MLILEEDIEVAVSLITEFIGGYIVECDFFCDDRSGASLEAAR